MSAEIQQIVSSGSYTPVETTASRVNVSATTLYPLSWSRNGNVVTCEFKVALQTIAETLTATTIVLSLPFPCTSTPAGSGGASNETVQDGNVSMGIWMLSATQMQCDCLRYTASYPTYRGMFQYTIN